VLAYGEAICCVPPTLVALCLNNGGLARVRASRPLDALLPVLASRKYVRALGGDFPSILGSALEELFRLVTSLRPDGLGVVISALQALCALGGARCGLHAATPHAHGSTRQGWVGANAGGRGRWGALSS
jgi:E3 ubiquitin-protein ligase HUWE1